MNEAWLIYNFGTQEPRVDVGGGEFIPLKDRAQPLASLLGVDAEGLWASARVVNESPQKYQLAFPILVPAIDYVLARPECLLKRVKLIATKSSHHEGLNDDDPRRDDTYWAAVLAKEWLEGKYPEVDVDVVPLRHDRPHLYSNARELLFQSGLLNGTSGETRLYICSSPGLPAVNSAVLQHVLHRHSGQCYVFQVEEPDPDLVRRNRGGSGKVQRVAETEMFLDLAVRQLVALVKEFQYKSAMELLEELPEGPGRGKVAIKVLLEEAIRQWNLELTVDPALGWERKYLQRIYGAFRIGSALLDGHMNDGVSWLADGFSFSRDFFYSVAQGGETYLTSEDNAKRPENWSSGLSKKNFWKDLCCFEPLQKIRNNFVHRLQGTLEATIVAKLTHRKALKKGEGLDCVSEKLEAVIDAAVLELGLGDPVQIKAPVADFRQMNAKILAAIERDLTRTER